ncbi:response regulator [Flavimarina sp. Hel_I_48]|uniref:response regulator n=1 Tax=Flavimarina sp. Hel_I_48 TaxID=1392488 RepID=UPI0013DBEDBB|nr:response regulator [Flavimarina sp. Hel_I_48]
MDSILLQAEKATDELRNEAAITKAAQLIDRAKINNEYNYLFYGYDLLGQNHLYLKDTSVAGEYTSKALDYALKSKNDTLIVTAFKNRAAWLGLSEKSRGEAIKMYQSALKIARKSVRDHIAAPALDLASLYHKMAKYELMPRNLREAEENLQGLKYDVTKEEIQLNILWGDYFKEENGNNLVAEYYNISYNLIKNRNDPALALDFYPRYAQFLNSIDSSQVAYKIQVEYQKIKDDLENERREEEVQKAMAAAGADELRRQRNEAELREMLVDEKLQRKNTQYTLMFILTVLMLFFIIYMYISTRMRKSLIKDLKYKNTELKAAKELAEDSVLAKSEFFSTVSHEMRTPLYGVTGMVNVLQNSKAADGFHEEFDSLKFSALHLLEIINDLLELSKLDDNSFEFHEHPFEIDLFVREIIKSFEKSQLKNSNKIHYIPEGDYPKIFIGDSRRIAQVLINLISNAIKFTVDGDIYIRLSCAYLEGSMRKLHFDVEDTGHGIPKSSLKSIFKEFNQIESPGIERKMGTGLGLPIVQKILRKMNSEISVESELGKGSTFSFDICLQEAHPQDFENENLRLLGNSLELDKTLHSSKILIVDDNKVNRIVTQRLLEQKHVVVMTAAGGKEAIQLMLNDVFDLILMDLQMPEMDGFETVIALRKFDSSTPIIALTASEIHTMKERLQECGFNDSVTKPFNLQDFYALIAKNLSSEPRIPIS